MQEIGTQKLTAQETQLVGNIKQRVIDAVTGTGVKNPEQAAASAWENFKDVLDRDGICAITGLLVQTGIKAGFLGGATMVAPTALTGESTAAGTVGGTTGAGADLALVHFQVLDAMCDVYRVYRRPISFRELEDLAEGI